MTETNPDPARRALAESIAAMLVAQYVDLAEGSSRRLAERSLRVSVDRAFACAEAVAAAEATSLCVSLIAARREVSRLELAIGSIAGLTLEAPGERGRPIPLPPLIRQITAESWAPKPAPDPRTMARWTSRWELYLRLLCADPSAVFDARLSDEDVREAKRGQISSGRSSN